MSHHPRSAERPVRARTLDRRQEKALGKAKPVAPLKPHQVGKLDKGLKD